MVVGLRPGARPGDPAGQPEVPDPVRHRGPRDRDPPGLQGSRLRYSAILYVGYCTVMYWTSLNCTVQYSIVYCVAMCYTVLYCTVLCCTVLRVDCWAPFWTVHTVLYWNALHCTALYLITYYAFAWLYRTPLCVLFCIRRLHIAICQLHTFIQYLHISGDYPCLVINP